nr:phage integrase SAM-like domain-containing protein [Flavobacteriales bacterium]
MGLGQKFAQVSVTLDKRRAKKDGTYPVKLYVWDIATKTGKHYSTGISTTPEDFHSAWETTKTRKEFKDLQSSIVNAQAIAERTIDGLNPFSFEAFERKGAIPKGQQANAFWYYGQKINELTAQGRIGTASNYQCSMNSLKAFANSESLLFSTITPKWLQSYEDDMVSNDRSLTTVGVYLRPLRAIFNDAIADNSNPLNLEHYPFGKRKYVIPAGMKSKSPLSKAELDRFITTDIESEAQKKARDFFFFSFACNGMNMKD